MAEQIKAIEFFEQSIKFSNSDVLAQVACTLSLWKEQSGLIDESLMDLQKACDIYEANYGLESA